MLAPGMRSLVPSPTAKRGGARAGMGTGQSQPPRKVLFVCLGNICRR